MTSTTVPQHRPPSLAARELATALRSEILDAAGAAEEQRRLPDGLRESLRAAGAFRLTTPVELGGHELPLDQLVAVYEDLARIDGSVAWNVWNGNFGFCVPLLPEAGIEAIWGGDRDPIIANSARVGGGAMPTADGFVLSGRWDIVSGIDSADWVTLFGIVLAEDGSGPRMTEQGPDVRAFFVQRDQIQILDTWQVTGMRGTGSNTVIVDGALVPETLAPSPFAPARAPYDRGVFRVPAFTIASIGCAGAVLGLAQSAIDELVALATDKPTDNGSTLRHRAHAHSAVAKASVSLRGARLALLAAAADVMADATAGRPIGFEQRAPLRAAMSHAADVSRDVLVSMYRLGSSSALYTGNRLERIFRDGMAATQHALLHDTHLETAGRIMFGLDPGTPVF